MRANGVRLGMGFLIYCLAVWLMTSPPLSLLLLFLGGAWYYAWQKRRAPRGVLTDKLFHHGLGPSQGATSIGVGFCHPDSGHQDLRVIGSEHFPDPLRDLEIYLAAKTSGTADERGGHRGL